MYRRDGTSFLGRSNSAGHVPQEQTSFLPILSDNISKPSCNYTFFNPSPPSNAFYFFLQRSGGSDLLDFSHLLEEVTIRSEILFYEKSYRNNFSLVAFKVFSGNEEKYLGCFALQEKGMLVI